MPDNSPILGVNYKAASSGNVAAGTTTATLAAVATQLNYLSGFIATGSGSTAGAAVNLTITGLVGGTQTYTFTAPASIITGAAPLVVNFPQPIPATAINTAIVVSMPTLGAGSTNSAIVAYGFSV